MKRPWSIRRLETLVRKLKGRSPSGFESQMKDTRLRAGTPVVDPRLYEAVRRMRRKQSFRKTVPEAQSPRCFYSSLVVRRPLRAMGAFPCGMRSDVVQAA